MIFSSITKCSLFLNLTKELSEKKNPENLTQTKSCDIKKRPVLQNHTTADVGSAADLSASRQTDAIQTEEIYV